MRTDTFGPKLFYFCFLWRRLLLAVMIVYAARTPQAQFMVITFATSLQVIYIGLSKPFQTSKMNNLELCNEYLLLSSCLFLFAYSDGLLIKMPEDARFDEGVSDEEAKFRLGWYNIGVIGLIVFTNVAVMVH